LKAIFKNLCPNCKNEIDDERLQCKMPCAVCLPVSVEEYKKLRNELKGYEFYKKIAYELRKLKKLKNYRDILSLEKEVNEVNELFKKILGNEMWSAQRTWAKRIIQKKSFSILAPTGVGKTAFAIIISLFLAQKRKKIYIVLPTTLLVKQVFEKTLNFMDKAGIDDIVVLAYHSGLKLSEKKSFYEKVKNGNFNIVITTSQFLLRNFEYLSGNHFDLIVVDDVDAVLKSSKSVDKILLLLGFSQEIIDSAYHFIMLKKRIATLLKSKKVIPKEIQAEYRKLSKSISKFLSKNKKNLGCLIVSTATGRPRGLRIKLFRELLGFEVGSRSEFLRNIADLYLNIKEEDLPKHIVDLVKTLGKGGLIFVPVSKGLDYAKFIKDILAKNGIKAAVVHAKEKEAIDEFAEGKVDVLIGVAIYYGLLVRGLDLPHVIRYAIFAGIPHFRFSLDVEEALPSRLLQVSLNIRECIEPEEKVHLDRITSKLRSIFNELSYGEILVLNEAVKTGKKLAGKLGYAQDLSFQLQNILKKLLERENVRTCLASIPMFSLKEIEGKLYVQIPDAMTYLQASGRTSRLFAGGLSRGVSIVLVDDERLFNGLVKQTKWYNDEIEWQNLEEMDIKKLIQKVDEDRNKIRLLMEGKLQMEIKDLVKTALVIVESPSKAKTIASFFGRPSRRKVGRQLVYEVTHGNYILNITASKGHVFDLVTEEGYYGVKKLNGRFIPVYTTIKRCKKCNTQFTDQEKCPVCKSEEYVDQLDVINSLIELAKEADYIFLATDPDTEGEKIAWDLYVALSPYTRNISRIEFHEVTRKAFSKALSTPRAIDDNYVNAQIVRRIEDRWIGFALSKKLWDAFGKRWLSAGRVQSPVLGWIIQRYREARQSRTTVFIVKIYDDITFVFDNIRLNSYKPREIVKKIKDAKLKIEEVKYSIEEVQPYPPFSTDSMLREASRLLKLGVDQIMRLAQDLFETGLITYHRTDSIRVSSIGQRVAESYIREELDHDLFVPREWSREGAHECIRPTRPISREKLIDLINQGLLVVTKPLTRNHLLLYDLIFRRFIASQMKPAKVLKQRIQISLLDAKKEHSGYVEIIEPGFTLIYKPFNLVRKLEKGEYEILDVKSKKIVMVPLYSQADIIQLMKEKEIGRPSTYAKIIRTLFDRHYIISSKRGKLIPTKLGISVYEYLRTNFYDFISEERTRIVERIMDGISEGKIDYQISLKEFYEEISKVESA